MTDLITLPTLGRDVNVGALYNYLTDEILTYQQVQSEYVERKTTAEMKFLLCFQQPELSFKHKMLGINSHLTGSTKKGYLNADAFWFTDFVNAVEDDQRTANVTIFTRIVRRTDSLRQNLIDRQIEQCQSNRDGRATHLVTQVVYGAELIVSVRRSVDGQLETKERVEQRIYSAAKSYFDRAIVSNWVIPSEPPIELENVTCNILSSQGSIKGTDYSFQQASQVIRYHVDGQYSEWRPIQIVLTHLPTVEGLIQSEKMSDIREEKKQNNTTWKKILTECEILNNHPHLRRLPPLKKVVYQLQDLLRPISVKMINVNKNCETRPLQEVLNDVEIISELLAGMQDWLICRRTEIEELCLLLKDTKLPIAHWEEIEEQMRSGKMSSAKIFVLKIDYKSDPLMEKILKFLEYQELTSWLPVFPILESDNIRLGEFIGDKLSHFQKEAELSSVSSSHRNTYFHIGLLSARSKCDDGDVFAMEYFYDQENEKDVIKTLKEEQSMSSVLKQTTHKQQEKKTETADVGNTRNSPSRQIISFNQNGKTKTNQMDSYDASLSRTNKDVEICLPIKRRVAEIFVKEYSQLMKTETKPNVYLLNAQIKSTASAFRWFDIGRPDGASPTFGFKNHKIIILMGATGSGKSTLINGMVNYILGVEWNDPFRFKCVHEDESECRNQAYSQTSSVTAYNIRHHEGMTVPYSITIIDTPGYGDTRGVARDKEITKTIHQFLTQKETRIDVIHSACFVAASGDSRLTVTQRYILDSVLSLFGKDFRENIRLLVTFADNADPPVIEACNAAHFPMTSSGISYSKFNSSVLYASNNQEEEEDFCFDELFWNMGQENFAKFFKMLEGMDGRDLTSTKQVIHYRRQQEQSLKEMERELEVYLVQIENIEMLRSRIVLLSGVNNNNYRKNYSNQKKANEELLLKYSDDLNVVKTRVLDLLEQVRVNAQSLDSTSLRSNALTPSDYLRLMRSRVAEQQAPGYLTRLETLNELEENLKQSDRFSVSRVKPLTRSVPGPSSSKRSSPFGARSKSDRYKSKSGVGSPIMSAPSQSTGQRKNVAQQESSVETIQPTSRNRETDLTHSTSSRNNNSSNHKLEEIEVEDNHGTQIKEKRRGNLLNRSMKKMKNKTMNFLI